jgi:hypothetical protein
MMPYLALAMQTRGYDSWGATDGKEIIKKLGQIKDSYVLSNFDHFKASGVFHTRAASCGAVTVENSHPFVSIKPDGSKIIGVHNGCLSNHSELNEKYNRTFAVDSQHIFEHMAQGLPLTELRGYGAVVWFEDNHLNFVRFNMTDFHVIELKSGPLVFCSTFTPMQDIARLLGIEIEHKFQLDNDTHYFVAENGELMCYKKGAMEFGPRYTAAPSYDRRTSSVIGFYNDAEYDASSYFSSASNTPKSPDRIADIGKGNRERGTCVQCYTAKIDRKKQIMCDACLQRLYDNSHSVDQHYEIYAN